MSLKNEPVSVEIESCAPSYEQGTPVCMSVLCRLALSLSLSRGGGGGGLIRTSIHDEYGLMLFWHMFLSILRL